MIEITISTGDLGLTLEQLTAALENRETLHLGAASAIEFLWSEHLGENYKTRDEGGVDYWTDVANSIESRGSAEGGSVAVYQEFIEDYYYGTTWTPGKSISSYTGRLTRALAIPSERVPVVDGRHIRPGRAGPLAFVQAKGGDVIGYLFEGEVTGQISRGKNKGKPRVRRNGPLLYTLKSSETVPADPGIMPGDDELKAAATTAMLDLLTAGF